jgi:hypothetical protein
MSPLLDYRSGAISGQKARVTFSDRVTMHETGGKGNSPEPESIQFTYCGLIRVSCRRTSPLVAGWWGQIPDGLWAGCEEDEGKDCTVGPDFTIVRVHQQGAGAHHARRDPSHGPRN